MTTGRATPLFRLRRLLAAAWLPCALLLHALPAAGAGPPSPPAPGSIEELWARGESAFKAGDLDEALRQFEAARARDEGRARTRNYLGGVYFSRGDFARALGEFQAAAALDPRDVRAANNLGTALERLGDYAGAAQAYARAVAIDPSYPATQRNLGILQSRRLGDPEGARRSWQRYLELAPNAADAPEIRSELDALPAR
jgi:tetratricopeptide (TPR) repeat protein